MPYKNPAASIYRKLTALLIVLIPFSSTVLSAQTADPPVSFKRCWEYPATNLSERGIASDNTRAYLSELGARLEAVSVDNGKRLWFSDLGGEIVSNIVEKGSAVFVAARSNETSANKKPKTLLRSLSKETGITNWVTELRDAAVIYLGISDGSLMSVSDSGNVTAIDASGGSVRWTTAINETISVPPHFSAGHVIAATGNKEIFVLSSGNGTVVYKKTVQYLPTAVFLVDDESGSWGDERGNLTLFKIGADKTIWKLKHGAAVSYIERVGGELLVASNDNFAYTIVLSNGHIAWKKRQPDRVFKPGLLSGSFIVLTSRTAGSSSILENDQGRLVDKIQLPNGENLIQSPVTAGGHILFPTATGISAYSVNGCAAK